MTTRRKTGVPRLRITQVHSIIGNQERVKRVVTDGLGLGRIGSSVVLTDTSYTRGMIAKAAHIVSFEELPAERHAAKADGAHAVVSEAVERLVEAVVSPVEKAPRRKKAGDEADAKPPAAEAKPAARATRKRTTAKSEE